MPPKGKGLTAGSFFNLAAEVEKQKEDFAKARNPSGSVDAIVGGVKRHEKKTTIWSRSNKGLASRLERDIESEALNRPTLERAQAALERKAKIYDKLKKGKTGGLTEKQYDALLVDFDAKVGESSDSSSDIDESLTVPVLPATADDPLVEYEDEFGRIRTARRSEVPRTLLPQELIPEDAFVIRGDAGYFPTYEPSEERVAAIQEAAQETDPAAYYDSTKEVRDKGAGFYQFSADTEERTRQQEELKHVREETLRARTESGAGSIDNTASVSSKLDYRKQQLEERKRKIEEKRNELEAKKRRKGNSEAKLKSATAEADRFLLDLENDLKAR